MVNRPAIWLTRPQADSEKLAAELSNHNIPTIIAPLMRIEPLTPKMPTGQPPSAMLLTSRHGAPALAQLPAAWRSIPIYCVGNATAQSAREQHFTNVISTNDDVLTLLPLLSADLLASSRLLYLAGEQTRVDVATLLAVHSITVETIVTYSAVNCDALSPELHDALTANQIGGVALFSPRSAALACELLTQHNLTDAAHSIEAYCLSLNVVEAAAALTWKALHACHRPTHEAMIDLIVSQHKKTL